MRTTALARVALFFLLALAGSAVAQIDARSQALLDGLMQDQQAAAVETLDQTMVMTMYSGGTETVSSTRTVIDYVNRRAVIFTDLGEGMMARLVHVDGVTTMRMEGMPMAIDRKSTRLNSSHVKISYAVLCLKKKKRQLE